MSTKRNPEEVIDKMIEALGGYESRPVACDKLECIKQDNRFRAPELAYITWNEVQEVLERTIIGRSEIGQFDEGQKAAIRIFTDNPNAV